MFIEFEKVFHAGVVKVCVDPATCQRVCEELWGVAAEDVYLHEEDPVEREREKVRSQQAASVNDVAPAFAEAARRETAEDAREDVVGHGQHLRRHQGHGDQMSYFTQNHHT